MGLIADLRSCQFGFYITPMSPWFVLLGTTVFMEFMVTNSTRQVKSNQFFNHCIK